MKPAAASRAEEISATLREEILRGQYRAGERLPSERDLAARFEANRGAVREAIKKLEQMGIADVTPGGVRVVPVEEATLDVLGHIIDLNESPDINLVNNLLEVLGALMSMSARTAVETASEEQLADMRAIVAELIDNSGVPEGSLQNDQCWRKLSLLFTRINKNLVLRLILNGLKTQFIGRMRPAEPGISVDRERMIDIFRQLDQGLARRDPKLAAAAIAAHFEYLQATIRQLQAITTAVPGSNSNA
ncbi:MAG: FadR/GntR family transcriptional regulator [Pseudomonadota bacterium]